MKKYLIFLAMLFTLSKNVHAISVSSLINTTHQNLCSSDGNMYELTYVWLEHRETFFLVPQTRDMLDTNVENYKKTTYEKSNYSKDIKDLYFAFMEIRDKLNVDERVYHSLTQRLIWEYLYPEKEFYFCYPNTKEKYEIYEDFYQKIKDKYFSVIKGPSFWNNTVNIEPGEIKEFQFDYLDNFYLYDNEDNLEVNIINDKLTVKGKEGKHKLVFRKKVLPIAEPLFEFLVTNGSNTLFSTTNFNDKKYVMEINGDKTSASILVYDEDKLVNKCININDEKYCSNENGMINLKLFEGTYNIFIKGDDIYEDFNENVNINDSLIKLKLNKKVIQNEENNENINNDENGNLENDNNENIDNDNNEENGNLENINNELISNDIFNNDDIDSENNIKDITFENTFSFSYKYLIILVTLLLFVGIKICVKKK